MSRWAPEAAAITGVLLRSILLLSFSLLPLSSKNNHPELPEPHYWAFPRQDILRHEGGKGPGLSVLRCLRLGPGYGIPVSKPL